MRVFYPIKSGNVSVTKPILIIMKHYMR